MVWKWFSGILCNQSDPISRSSCFGCKTFPLCPHLISQQSWSDKLSTNAMKSVEEKSLRSLSSQSREAIVYIAVVLIIYIVVLVALMIRASPVYEEKKGRRRTRKSKRWNIFGKCQTLVKWEDNKDCPVDPEMGLTKPASV